MRGQNVSDPNGPPRLRGNALENLRRSYHIYNRHTNCMKILQDAEACGLVRPQSHFELVHFRAALISQGGVGL